VRAGVFRVEKFEARRLRKYDAGAHSPIKRATATDKGQPSRGTLKIVLEINKNHCFKRYLIINGKDIALIPYKNKIPHFIFVDSSSFGSKEAIKYAPPNINIADNSDTIIFSIYFIIAFIFSAFFCDEIFVFSYYFCPSYVFL